ncbi:MAG: phosphoenolpyruvate carboxykinase (ATP) [Acidobacteriota bacterium]
MPDGINSLSALGFVNLGNIFWDLPTTALFEEAIRTKEGLTAHLGPLVVRTGQYTGRSPMDKFLVEEPGSSGKIWWGAVNKKFSPDNYEDLRNRVLAYYQGRDIFVQSLYAGADERYRTPIRVITPSAWHAMFARTMFIRELDREKLQAFTPEYTLIHAPAFRAIPESDHTRSEVFVILHFGRREILIGGTSYAGEMKKSVFTMMNYLLPLKNVLSMHCSANYGKDRDDVALFFGLSGTGKTTLSIESRRTLIGDDEHGWSDDGIFNLEGGCYAKVIRISRDHEPEIFETTRKFGTILENVTIDRQTRRLNLDDDSLTENTRAAFPISHLENADRSGVAGHPKYVFFLTADAFGVLPPIARLTREQAIYYFLLGYTAKVAGTERGVKEPEATFSACFGAPFMVHSPTLYAHMLGDRIARHNAEVWLVNTGWTGGRYGEGKRIHLPFTRAMIQSVYAGALAHSRFEEDPVFRLQVPAEIPGVPREVLRPRSTWRDPPDYDRKAAELAERFAEAFRPFESEASSEVCAAGPRLMSLK